VREERPARVSPRYRALAAVLIALALAVGVRDLSRSWFFPLAPQQLDLRPLYCAGTAANAGASPYALEPIRTCEHRYAAPLLRASPNLAMPFVMPGYVVPLVRLLAGMPFAAAAALYTALAALALLAAIVLSARALNVGMLPAAAGIALSAGFTSIPLGQVGTFELLAIAAAGWALAKRHDALAALCAAASLVEPHVGAFVVVALFVLAPRTRTVIVLACAALALAAVAFSAPREQLAYLTSSLPGQAYANIRGNEQYSLTYVAAFLGAPDRLALALGSLSTLLLLVASVPVARACALRGQRAALAFVPAAFAVVGGAYIHLTQIALAAPAALLFVAIARDRREKIFAGAAFVLLAIPWPFPAQTKQLLVLSLLAVALVAWHVTAGSLRAVAAIVVVCWAAMFWTENHLAPADRIPVLPHYPASTPIALEVRAWTEQVANPTAYGTALKLPTWCGLLAVLTCGLLVLRRTAVAPDAS